MQWFFPNHTPAGRSRMAPLKNGAFESITKPVNRLHWYFWEIECFSPFSQQWNIILYHDQWPLQMINYLLIILMLWNQCGLCYLKVITPAYFFEKGHTTDDFKLFSKSCYEFSAVCVFSKFSRFSKFSVLMTFTWLSGIFLVITTSLCLSYCANFQLLHF